MPVDGLPRREVLGQLTPRAARAQQAQDRVDHLPPRMRLRPPTRLQCRCCGSLPSSAWRCGWTLSVPDASLRRKTPTVLWRGGRWAEGRSAGIWASRRRSAYERPSDRERDLIADGRRNAVADLSERRAHRPVKVPGGRETLKAAGNLEGPRSRQPTGESGRSPARTVVPRRGSRRRRSARCEGAPMPSGHLRC